MGGKGSGGRRPGAGRKPKSIGLKIVHGTATGAERARYAESLDPLPAGPADPGPAAPVGPTGPVDPRAAALGRIEVPAPAGMTEAELDVWVDLAPKAIAGRTLTVETAEAFRLLCKAVVMERRYLAEIERDGLTVDTPQGLKAHPLVAAHRNMMQRVEAGFVRFCLAPIGKALDDVAGDAKPISKLAALRSAFAS